MSLIDSRQAGSVDGASEHVNTTCAESNVPEVCLWVSMWKWVRKVVGGVVSKVFGLRRMRTTQAEVGTGGQSAPISAEATLNEQESARAMMEHESAEALSSDVTETGNNGEVVGDDGRGVAAGRTERRYTTIPPAPPEPEEEVDEELALGEGEEVIAQFDDEGGEDEGGAATLDPKDDTEVGNTVEKPVVVPVEPKTETQMQGNEDEEPLRVWRVEVYPRDAGDDPVGENVLHEANELELGTNIEAVQSCRIYLIEANYDEKEVEAIAAGLLSDPVNERYVIGATPAKQGVSLIEVHYLPGVMDPVAISTRDAIVEMLGENDELDVRTGFRYDMVNATSEQAMEIAERLLANSVIQEIKTVPHLPASFLHGQPYELKLGHVNIRDLDDDALMVLSREGHLFLSLDEMKGVQAYYQERGCEPTDIELETLAQTWSEHCVHKTLKSRVNYTETVGASPTLADWDGRSGHTLLEDGSLEIDNLLKSTIAAATNELIDGGLDWCISVFVDNAGIIKFDDEDAVTFKVETHNHPSAIEPYGGAATGAGGCIRDTMGTGLAAKPIANTDIFCVANPTLSFDELPKGVLHPKRVLKQVVGGVRDYGNRMGIPTVNGLVWFDDRYLGNPLVFCGSVGLIPNDKCFGDAQQGDRIIVIGGRTGRDGIHGATFSSAELTDTHADEFSHAVQIGNAITEKKALDVILQARDHESGCLYSAVTDCGAGGYSSAVGEMGEKIGAFVELDKAPLKYDGLSYTEIWISEAQERMVLAVPAEKVETLQALCDAEDVELCDLGYFGTEDAELILNYEGTEVGRMSMDFMHNGIPQPTRKAVWAGGKGSFVKEAETDDVGELLKRLLGHPNIASKHWIIKQYDHEVQGGAVVRPLTGPGQDGPSDAAVLRPKLDSDKAIALSCGLATALGDVDPYWMVLASIDEAVRNAVCVGARPDRIAILDNFCWAKCDREENLGALVRASVACYDGAMAYRTPFISGKDSLNNEFTTESGEVIAIPPTLLISAIGIVDDAKQCVTMDAKSAGNLLIQVGQTKESLGAAHVGFVGGVVNNELPKVDLKRAPQQLAKVAELIAKGLVRSAHDCSEGGMLLAGAEMAFAGGIGLNIDLGGVPSGEALSETAACFAETPSRILLEIEPGQFDTVARLLTEADVPFGEVGRFNESDRVTVQSSGGQLMDAGLDELRDAWKQPLDW